MVRCAYFVGLFLLGSTTFSICQEQQPPSSPEDALSARQLIAWSTLQKPQPTPQPLPPRDTPVPQPDQQQGDASAPSTESPSAQPSRAAQSFTGKVVRDGRNYVLKVAKDVTYRLEGVEDAEKYENQNIRVVGNLDDSGNTIRVVRIELLS